MEHITLSVAWGWILAAAAAIVALDKAWQIIHKKLHPEADLREAMKKYDGFFERDFQRLGTLEEKQAESSEFQTVICRVMLAQLNHELSGNDVANLRKARDELNNYLTAK